MTRLVALGVAWLVTAVGAPGAEPADNSIGMRFVRIRAGEFVMGSPAGEPGRRDDETCHVVHITSDYDMSRFEVTRGQFRAFVAATGFQTESERTGVGGYGFDATTGKLAGRDLKYSWRFTGFEQTDEHPVVNVTWNDAVAFCEWLTRSSGEVHRLPTEAEWEYACRAGTSTAFSFGDDKEQLIHHGNVVDRQAQAVFPDRIAIAGQDGFVFTAPVGTYRPNAWGLHDMTGNVWEWCADWFAPHTADKQTDPQGPGEQPLGRVIKGGDWYHDWSFARSAQRFPIPPTLTRRHGGFRVVREVR